MEGLYSKLFYILLGALIPASIAFGLSIRKIIVEQHNEKCKEMIKSVLISTDVAFEYWSTQHGDDKILIKEAKLFSSQCLVNSYYTALYNSLNKSKQKKIAMVFSEYSRELTGDDFGVKGREINPNKMKRLAQISGNLISNIYDCYKKW